MGARAFVSVFTAMSQIGRLVSRCSPSGSSFGHSMTEGLYGLKVSWNIWQAASRCCCVPTGNGSAVGQCHSRARESAASIAAMVGGIAIRVVDGPVNWVVSVEVHYRLHSVGRQSPVSPGAPMVSAAH